MDDTLGEGRGGVEQNESSTRETNERFLHAASLTTFTFYL